MGRIDLYETAVAPKLADIKRWIQSMSEEEIAKQLGVSKNSFTKYKKEHEELQKALQDGKRALVKELKDTLKKKAKGFTYTETKKTTKNEDGVITEITEVFTKYSPPDTGAIHLLLKNLDPEWRNDDKQTMDLKREKMTLEKKKSEAENW